MGKRARGILITLIGAALLGLCAAPAAVADPRVYWTDQALPPDAGVSYANLDDTGGADANLSGATPSGSAGVVIDAAANRLYWADFDTSAISYANLDGSGGGHLNPGDATVDGPSGMALDLAAGKVFWSNGGDDAHPISWAYLNGTGGGNLKTTDATAASPNGLALDLAANRVYWANGNNNTISYAKLDDTGGGGQLTSADTLGATLHGPQGIAIDLAANRIYWSNYSDNAHPVSYANLDGTGGGHDLDPGIAHPHGAGFPALLEPPAAGHIPRITGKSAVGSTLHCTRGFWAPDVLGSFLFRDPRSFAYHWRRNGTPIAGATQNSLHLSVQGHYRCAVAANNYVGSATQLSAIRNVVACVVPTLTHKSIPQARTALRKARCTLGHVTGPTGTSARIKAQTPKPGTQHAPGSKVNVTTQ